MGIIRTASLGAGLALTLGSGVWASADVPARLAVGDRMPALKGDLLTGKPAVLPDSAAGRVTLVALGFSYGSRGQVEAWVGRFRERFGERQGVAAFEVPMMGSAARLGRWFIDSGMRRGTPASLHGYVMTVYGGNGDWKARVGFGAPDAAYLVLVDQQGVVQWLFSGPATDARFEDLAAVVDRLSSSPPSGSSASPSI
jgi:hypothetical protein